MDLLDKCPRRGPVPHEEPAQTVQTAALTSLCSPLLDYESFRTGAGKTRSNRNLRALFFFFLTSVKTCFCCFYVTRQATRHSLSDENCAAWAIMSHYGESCVDVCLAFDWSHSERERINSALSGGRTESKTLESELLILKCQGSLLWMRLGIDPRW